MTFISDMTDDTFPKEIWDRKGVYYQGKTKDNYPICKCMFCGK